ncbi:MAG: hypothetical protein K8R37_15700 [Bacteroidales bacterium]|nr:hypothetical protein [Bacteroidales bacterium]
MENKIKILVIGLMIAAITFVVIIVGNVVLGYSLYNFAEPKVSGVRISYDVVCTQGAAENLTGMESVKVYGTVSNTGDEELKNITVTVIFTDTAHDRVVRQTVVEGVYLLPDGAVSVEFDAEYLRELTIPKTSVNETIQVDWVEDGELRTFTTR